MAQNKTKTERRSFSLGEFRAEAREGEQRMLAGLAAVFGAEADLGWFVETIAPGAFAETIANDDIRALFNHNTNFILGRNTAGTLRLKEDDRGLAFEIDPPDTQIGRDLAISIERKDITNMSFGFQAIDEKWELMPDKRERRTLLRVKLFEISPVTFPAYAETEIAQRSAEAWRAAQPRGRSLDVERRRLDLITATL